VHEAGRQPGIPSDVEAIDEKGAPLLHRVHGDGCIANPPADAAKGLGLVEFGVSFGSDELTVSGETPVVRAAGPKEDPCEGTKRPYQLGGIDALESSPGEFEEKLLERLVRLRRNASLRISSVSGQRTPIA